MDGEELRLGRSGKRKAGRLRLRLPAQAISHRGTVRVVLCDLSEGGAKVFTGAELVCGRDLVLQWDGREAFGAIIWQRDGFYGIQFDEPMSGPALVEIRHLQDRQGMDGKAIAEWLAEKTEWAFGKALR